MAKANAKTANKAPQQALTDRAAAVAQAAVNRQKALQMRIQGKPVRAIAEALGVAVSTAHGYITDELAEVRDATKEVREKLRDIERARLEAILDRWLPIALHENLDVSTDIEGRGGELKHIELPDYQAGLKAAETVIKISARLSALDGLDAPVKQEHSGTVGIENASTIRKRMAARTKGS